ncbi:uncharacterized protein LOC143543041 [Bidens hawaiensis]|uniref:uncharacterized protein LOC143543041 n=1 Tax=Bidens hawaiensis TaxID=980011 RepID=UPI0040492587
MEHNNGGGSSIIDEDSSSSSSSSNHFEVDIRENDAANLELDESPSMMITLPQTYDFNTLNGSPKQSPPVQVMWQPAGYDVNRSPSPLFGLKHRSNSDWSLSSGESLFSIHTGIYSFTLDNGYFISKSGEFNWIDDHSCSTPDGNKSCMSPTPPTVIDTSAENESGEKEEVTETQNVSPIGSANSAKNSRLSDASCQSTSSFAFPVLAEGSPSRTKVEAEKPEAAPSAPPAEAAPSTPPAEAAQTTPKAASTVPKAGGNQWFHCFSCFPMCC